MVILTMTPTGLSDEVKLDIGSGGPAAHYLGPGWLGVDPFVTTADVLAPMWALPFNNETVTEIFTSHALEHVAKHQVMPTLNEWYRALKPSGKLTIRVPDLEWCVRHWLNHKDSTGWDLDIIFGNQNHEGEFHKTGFTETTLRNYVLRAGFVIEKVEYLQTHSQQTLSLEAVKPC